MLSIAISVVAYFVASRFIRRYLDEADIPKSMARSALTIALSLALACAVAAFIGRLGR